MDVELALKHKFETTPFVYTGEYQSCYLEEFLLILMDAERDSILYALGVGESHDDPLDDGALKFTYENHPNFSALPTMGIPYFEVHFFKVFYSLFR